MCHVCTCPVSWRLSWPDTVPRVLDRAYFAPCHGQPVEIIGALSRRILRGSPLGKRVLRRGSLLGKRVLRRAVVQACRNSPRDLTTGIKREALKILLDREAGPLSAGSVLRALASITDVPTGPVNEPGRWMRQGCSSGGSRFGRRLADSLSDTGIERAAHDAGRSRRRGSRSGNAFSLAAIEPSAGGSARRRGFCDNQP